MAFRNYSRQCAISLILSTLVLWTDCDHQNPDEAPGLLEFQSQESYFSNQSLMHEPMSDDSILDDPISDESISGEFVQDLNQIESDINYSSSGTCTVCFPDYRLECSSGTLSWETLCNLQGCFASGFGGTCGFCYCGTVCDEFPNTGNVGAAPPVVAIPDGQNTGCTTINWDVDCGDSQVWVSHNGNPETLFSQGPQGTQQACWIQLDHHYSFRLYLGTSREKLLDTVDVIGISRCDRCPQGTSCRCGENFCIPNNAPCP